MTPCRDCGVPVPPLGPNARAYFGDRARDPVRCQPCRDAHAATLRSRQCNQCGREFRYDAERYKRLGWRPPGRCFDCANARAGRLVTLEGVVETTGARFAIIRSAAGERFFWRYLRGAEHGDESTIPAVGLRVRFLRDPHEVAKADRLPSAREVEVLGDDAGHAAPADLADAPAAGDAEVDPVVVPEYRRLCTQHELVLDEEELSPWCPGGGGHRPEKWHVVNRRGEVVIPAARLSSGRKRQGASR